MAYVSMFFAPLYGLSLVALSCCYQTKPNQTKRAILTALTVVIITVALDYDVCTYVCMYLLASMCASGCRSKIIKMCTCVCVRTFAVLGRVLIDDLLVCD